ncbi:cupin domain-containing protein [Alkalimonas amylolytica]|uniref:50S ribosomal protein L16 3-hydroxylase n=1 Tax=Alkalimonas amylolytica TaxID=152573 RepID=A0A1H4B2Z5_ALKAM|nr:cupin domain-containing protein [Alkalimonas amylolytica]SEA42252.1 50S ribosomal protein L16 3-hydroxylase [Alkalimonas amylolytica]
MYSLNFGSLTIEQFLAEYWQQKPLLIKGGFANFQDPISADELAGLALDEQVDGRLIQKDGGNWQLDEGPFDSFDKYGDQNWTLLVQAVDYWQPDAARLLEPFRFIPNWRIDDLMVSFSAPGGGVGPHLDQYDVFIIQGMGKRRWRVGMPDASLEQFCPHPRLLQVSDFNACIDDVMEPGDILYIPPGCPHDGISLEPSLNYSVGFRAPAQKDLIGGLADYLLDFQIEGERFNDPGRLRSLSPGEINSRDLGQVRQLMQQLLADDDLLSHWFGSYISQAKRELDLQEPEPHYQAEEIAEYLDEGSVLGRLGGLRCCYQQAKAEGDVQLFINGDRFPLPANEIDSARLLTDRSQLTEAECRHFVQTPERLAFITQLINQGYWYFVE